MLFFSIYILISSCNNTTESERRKWKLVWEDEFDGVAGTLPDAEKWKFDMGTDWGNRQLEYDTDRAENASMDGEGNLVITARKESYLGSDYTSARIKTQGLFEQKYGRFEARILMPWGRGIWPAFWLLGSNFATIGWPTCGEIDIMEYRGQEPSTVHATVHGPGYSAGNGISESYELPNDRFDVGFHLFAVEWGDGYMDFYVDDHLYHSITPEDAPGEWVFDQSFFIILNVAVGGNYVGSPNEYTQFPQKMLVDYVKVYQEEK
jgi:beta-glucanase (GH16 family)